MEKISTLETRTNGVYGYRSGKYCGEVEPPVATISEGKTNYAFKFLKY